MRGETADRTGDLAAALRNAASRAADAASGGVALVFAAGGDALDLRLRAASGFAAADDARQAAGVVLPHVRDVVRRLSLVSGLFLRVVRVLDEEVPSSQGTVDSSIVVGE